MLLAVILTACCDVSRAVRSWESCSRRAEYCFCRAMCSGSWYLVSMEGRFRAVAGRVGDESGACVREVGFGSADGPGDGEDGVGSMGATVGCGGD